MFSLVAALAAAAGTASAALIPGINNELPADASLFKFYDMPTQRAGPCDLTTGPDGAIWIQDLLVNKISRLDLDTGAIVEYGIPYTYPLANVTGDLPHTALACAIQPGNDGNIYAATGLRNQFVKVTLPVTDPKKDIRVFTPPDYNPLGDLIFLNDQFAGPDGQYFTQTTNNKLTKFDYKTEQLTSFDYPFPSSGPVGVFNPPADPKGIWTCEFLGNKIARFDTDTHKFKEYPVLPTLLEPGVTRAQTSDGYLWFVATGAMALGRVDLKTGAMKAYTIPFPLSVPLENSVDGSDRVWYSSGSHDALEYLDTKTGKFGKVDQPGVVSAIPGIPPYLSVAIHWDKAHNRMVFTDPLANRVGTYQL